MTIYKYRLNSKKLLFFEMMFFRLIEDIYIWLRNQPKRLRAKSGVVGLTMRSSV